MRLSRAFAVLVVAAAIGVWSQPHTMSEVANLTPTCLASLDTLYGYYLNAIYPKNDCDPACLKQCQATLEQAINAVATKNCPTQDEITYCFGLFPDMWVNYVQTCGLLPFSSADAEAAALAAEAAQQTNPEYNASRSVTYQPVLSSTTTATRRRLQGFSGEDEGVGEPLVGATDSVRRRLLSLASVGESGESNGIGCFPTFVNSYDFEFYITDPQGWFKANWSHKSNTNGIIVSCIFWVVFFVILFNTKGFKFWKKKKSLSEKVAEARQRKAEMKAARKQARLDAEAAAAGKLGEPEPSSFSKGNGDYVADVGHQDSTSSGEGVANVTADKPVKGDF